MLVDLQVVVEGEVDSLTRDVTTWDVAVARVVKALVVSTKNGETHISCLLHSHVHRSAHCLVSVNYPRTVI